MSKENRLNIRITPDFKKELAAIAKYHGLTVSSYVHSALVQKIRVEREANPEAFAPTIGLEHEELPSGNVVHHPNSRKIAERMVEQDAETLAEVTGKLSRVNNRKLDLNAEEGTEGDNRRVSTPRKRAGGR